ncbi:hypothetical protein H0H87_000040 [Tephrocybe sp. NHM501043]|nr:hypothetical protein H0H87_000040 [Tephrocybe sp. NHM501043]
MAFILSHFSFLHPGDEDWPGLKPRPQEKRAIPSSSHKDSRDGTTDDRANTPSRRVEPRSGPLVSQEDLFLRKLLSEDEQPYLSSSQARRQFSDDNRDRGRDTKRNKDAASRNNSKNRSRRYDDFSYLGVKKPTASIHSPNANTQRLRVVRFIYFSFLAIDLIEGLQVSGTKRKFSEDLDAPTPKVKSNSQDAPITTDSAVSTAFNTGASVSGLQLDAPSNLPRSNFGQEVVSMFRELSRSADTSSLCQWHSTTHICVRLAAQATEDAVSQARDDRKLKVYTDLSSLLSKISPKAAAAVTSPLADILLQYAQGKQRAEDNLKALSVVWAKAFDMLTGDISRAVDVTLAEAVKKIVDTAELAKKSVILHPSTLQEQHAEASSGCYGDHIRSTTSEPRHLKETDLSSKRDQKRRRISDISPPPEIKLTPAQPVVKVEQNIHEILSQMKAKIDEQAQSLHKLTKENNAVRHSP